MYGITTTENPNQRTPERVHAPFNRADQESGQLPEEMQGDLMLEGLLSDLGAHVQRAWQRAKMAKERHQQELLRCLRQRNGEYEPEDLRVIREQGGSEIYMMLTQVKCRATESWIMDMMFPPGGEKPYGAESTPVPDLPPEYHQQVEQAVMAEAQEAIMMGLHPTQEQVQARIEQVEGKIMEMVEAFAKERAKRMEKHLNDITDEGGFDDALEEFISDFVTYLAAFLKGPIRINKKRLKWGEDQWGQTYPVTEMETVRKFERVSPFDMYPAADARTLDDGDLIRIQRYRRKTLYDLIGVKGYDEAAIREVIHDYGETGHRLVKHRESERERLEGRDHDQVFGGEVIEAIEFWGKVRGQWLLDRRLPADQIPDPDDDYEANVVMIGRHVIRAALNPHPLGRRPYYCESLERVNGQIWGKGVPQIIRDLQRMCNAAARSLANNMAFASGPMADVMVDRLAEGQDMDWYPWKTIQTQESKTGNTTRPAVQFFQPQSNARELQTVYKFFSELADEYSGIPPYAVGTNTRSGAAGTATGMGMLQENAARGIKRGVKAIDRVIRGVIQGTFEDVMLYDDKPEIKGDLRIVAHGSSILVNRERQAMRLNEMMGITMNPVDQQIIGLEGRRKMLEDYFQAHDIDPTDKLPTADQLQMMMMNQQQMEAMQAQQQGKSRELTADGRPMGGPQAA